MKDIFCSYYTDSTDITNYMVNKLNIENNDVILEPSAGTGMFIDELIKENKNIKIEAIDINDEAISILSEKYKNVNNLAIRKTDTLLDEKLDYISFTNGYYTKIIGNPPYGAWQDYKKRDLLKKRYNGQYVKETYTLFLYRCISLLKNNGRLSFIIPDTYLFLNMHSKLRKFLLTNTKIEEILIFPSKFFPRVSFGYSNLSIITLQKVKKDCALKNNIRIVKGFSSSKEFYNILNNQNVEKFEIFNINQKEILEQPQSRVLLTKNNDSKVLLNNNLKIGDIADVVTGFYCGDNKKFLRVANTSVKGEKNYEKINMNKVYNCYSVSGIDNVNEGYIPYIKSASKNKYVRNKVEWYVRWDSDTVKFYNNDKKARFQNSKFYFKEGIAIPMVKSSIINATLMKNNVFDQSIVGIFPKDSSRMYYLLAVMNSDVVNNLIHIINPTANNSANYVKQIPYIEPENAMLENINEKVKMIIEGITSNNYQRVEELQREVNTIIDKIYAV